MPNLDSLTWLESTGGPLILLEEDLVPYWRGVLPVSDSSVTDYERACEVSDYLGRIDVASRSAVLFGEQPYSTTWWQSRELGYGLIVRWVCGENMASVSNTLTKFSNSNWEKTDVEFEVSKGSLVLFDSAAPGTNIETFILVEMPQGNYVGETLHYNPDKDTSLILHRFVPIQAM